MSKIVDRIFNTVLTADDSTAQEELGSLRFEDGRIYKYVHFTDSITAVAGGCAVMDGTYNYRVTMDLDGGLTDAAVGIALTTNQPNYYGWVQIYGTGTGRTTDYITANDMLIATADNILGLGVSSVTSDAAAITYITEHKFVATALENSGTDVTATIGIFIRCM